MKTDMLVWATVICFLLGGPRETIASKFIDNLNAGKTQTIVFMGTSLTQGGLYIGPVSSWLESLYPGQTTIINSGVGGQTSRYGMANVATLAKQYNPHTVFIEYAINDAWRSSVNQPESISLAESRSNHLAIIQSLRSHNPDVEIILMTMNVIHQAVDVRPNVAKYYQVVRDIAQEQGLLVIDHHPNWASLLYYNLTQFDVYVTDGLHPLRPGYEAIFLPEFQKRVTSLNLKGDLNGDGNVETDDLALFEHCASGPTIPLTIGCGGCDFDHDLDVDQEDFGALQFLLRLQGRQRD